MDEDENSESLNVIEEHLYSQLHHERIESNLNNEFVRQEEENLGNDIRFKSAASKQGIYAEFQIANLTESKITSTLLPKLTDNSEEPNFHKSYNTLENTSKTVKLHVVKCPIAKRCFKSKEKVQQKLPKKMRDYATQVIPTIEIVSSDEDNDDVVLVPGPVVPIYSIDDSDDSEAEKNKKANVLSFTENAIDSSDVQINENNFAKPIQMTYTSEKRALDNSSRCTSPSSVYSADDFIVQQDRQRLKSNTLVTDNDEIKIIHDKKISSNENSPDVYVVEETGNKKYRVEQPQFRALDVYESESDIPESIYTKGKETRKDTVIRTITSTDDEDACVIEESNSKVKRFHKRRLSNSRKSSETCLGVEESSEDDSEILKNNPPIKVSYIESSFKTVKSRKLSKSNQCYQENDSFIAAINCLAQGEMEELENDHDDSLTSREIAESVLEKRKKKRPQRNCNNNHSHIGATQEAVEIFGNIDKILELVDDVEKNIENENNVAQECAIIAKTNDSNTVFEINSSMHCDEDVISRKICIENRKISKKPSTNIIKNHLYYKYNIYNINSKEFPKSPFGIGWNEEQRRFYANSWNGENFNIKNLWNSMSNNRRLWKVSPSDPYANAVKPNNKSKCFNCCQFGHKRQRCPFPLRPKVCRICGEDGHIDINCYKKCCLRCGTTTNAFNKSCNSCLFQNRLICSLCKIRGHGLDTCPDKWRRYHSTVRSNTNLNGKVIYNTHIYCYNCGKSGHQGDECKKETNYASYPKITSRIISYEKSYNDGQCKNHANGILCNLMYDPSKCINVFNLVELTKPRNYYGRFLNAVGLGHLLRKRRATPPTESSIQPIKKTKKLNSTDGLQSHQSISTKTKVSEEIRLDQNQHQSCPEIIYKAAIVPSGVLDYVAATKQQNMSLPSEKRNMTEEEKVSVLDSDSNYSFSDHFEMNQSERPPKYNINSSQSSKTRVPMGPTPDFIPLECRKHGKQMDEAVENAINCNIMTDTDDETLNNIPNCNSDTPVVAKIYLTYQRGKYLTLPEGKKLLRKLSEETNIASSLHWSSAGPIITLEGLSTNQDEFHRRLQVLLKEFNENIRRNKNETSQQMPKRVGVLIRFLVEHFDMLRTNLGNAIDLHKRLKHLDRQDEPSKSSLKNADKLRRQLNMILIGQAGLRNGKDHLHAIIRILKTLQKDYKVEESVPNFLRDQLFDHWKRIFTPFRHENYEELMQHYKNLNNKNNFSSSNIDKMVLTNNHLIDVNFTTEQKERMNLAQINQSDSYKPEASVNTNNNLILNGNSIPIVNGPVNKMGDDEKSCKLHTAAFTDDVNICIKKNDSPLIATVIKTSMRVSPFIQHEKNSNFLMNINPTVWATNLKAMLSDIDISANNTAPKGNSNSNKPSIFWSRECLEFLNKCLQLSCTRPEILKVLDRVIAKAHAGLLSCNDYIALKKFSDAI